MTLKDIIKYDRKELINIGFVFASEYKKPDKYFTVKIHPLHG